MATSSRPFLPALPAAAFMHAYSTWRRKHGLQGNNDVPTINGRIVNLHTLHTEVLSEASRATIASPAQWQMIAERLGLARPPHGAANTATASSAVAAQLQDIYNQYLKEFDAVYLGSVVNGNVTLVAAHPGAVGRRI
ncbi:hypothetical protein NM688_g8542 [Phlebia brevispora]|uniref:Uncharacterized protein n=1 Tax=Phlebia brevispora TaxID=194682 RepID=A0ACC1RU77_9APHY|nr:hypothetical protein NM688_g8542 [Phlebia brevispora]